MIRVWLYARYSPDDQDDSSITDQFRNCVQPDPEHAAEEDRP